MEALVLRVVVVGAVVVATVLAGRWWRHRDGRLQLADDRTDGSGQLSEAELAEAGLDVDAEVRALLLSSPGCRPCRTVRNLLAEVADGRCDVAWQSVDAADHLELTRRHRVLRVPTVLFIDRDGQVLARSSGVPRAADLRALLDDHSPAVTTSVPSFERTA